MILEALRIERELVQFMLSVLFDDHASEFEKVTIVEEHARAIRRTDAALTNRKLLIQLLERESNRRETNDT